MSVKCRLKFTLAKALAISNVPTVSMLEAMIGTPRYVFLELRNLISLCNSTCEIGDSGLATRQIFL